MRRAALGAFIALAFACVSGTEPEPLTHCIYVTVDGEKWVADTITVEGPCPEEQPVP